MLGLKLYSAYPRQRKPLQIIKALSTMLRNPWQKLLRCILLLMMSFLTGWVSCNQPKTRPNLVLITVDTLRADHLNAYGYSRNTSPFLEELARESFLFENVISQSGSTQPSLSSLMTGLYPHTDKINIPNGPFLFLKRGNVTLAKVLGENGYQTHAITSQIQTAPVTGLDLGFGSFDSVAIDPVTKSQIARTAEDITKLALEWIKDRKGSASPFFLWLHFVDPHYPYKAPDAYNEFFVDEEPREEGKTRFYRLDERRTKRFPLTEAELLRYIINYDREIVFTDQSLRLLFTEGLNDLLKNTMVIFTADHGEALGNHGMITHNELYQTILHVPLLIRLPGEHSAGKRIKEPVMLVDIVPTLMDLLDLSGDVSTRGKNLSSLLISGEANDMEGRFRLAEYPRRQAYIFDGVKLILNQGRRELYDLKQDWYESDDLSGSMTEYQEMMIEKASQLQDEAYGFEAGARDTLPEVKPEMIEELKALGYVVE